MIPHYSVIGKYLVAKILGGKSTKGRGRIEATSAEKKTEVESQGTLLG